MITAIYSSVLYQPIASVWSLIRDFNNYPIYIEGVTQSVIENDKRGDEVGAVRRFLYGGNWIRQRLSAHSDEQHSLTYIGEEAFDFPASTGTHTPGPVHYEGTMHLLPIVNGNRTFIEWSVTLDALPHEGEQWRSLLLTLISIWTESLHKALSSRSEQSSYSHSIPQTAYDGLRARGRKVTSD